jgi:hypothetical protein
LVAAFAVTTLILVSFAGGREKANRLLEEEAYRLQEDVVTALGEHGQHISGYDDEENLEETHKKRLEQHEAQAISEKDVREQLEAEARLQNAPQLSVLEAALATRQQAAATFATQLETLANLPAAREARVAFELEALRSTARGLSSRVLEQLEAMSPTKTPSVMVSPQSEAPRKGFFAKIGDFFGNMFKPRR